MTHSRQILPGWRRREPITVDIQIGHLASRKIDPDSWDSLSPDEVDRAQRLTNQRERTRFVEARTILRRTLAAELGKRPESIEFAYGVHGKPHLHRSMGADIEFSLSHTEDAIALAIAPGCPVGVDIEKIHQRSDVTELAAEILHPDELAAFNEIATAERRTAAFFRAWTHKEAILKASGSGLITDPRSVRIPETTTIDGFLSVTVSNRTFLVCDLHSTATHAAAFAIRDDVPPLLRIVGLGEVGRFRKCAPLLPADLAISNDMPLAFGR